MNKRDASELHELYGENFTRLNALYFEKPSPLTRAGAYILTAAGVETGDAALRAARDYVAAAESGFDGYGEQFEPVLTACTALDPERELLIHAVQAFRALCERFPASNCLVTAAYALARRCNGDFDEPVKRVKELYDNFSLNHPLITGYEDIIICTLLVLAGREDAEERIDRCTAGLRRLYRMTNSVQTLAGVLALAEDDSAACGRLPGLETALRACGLRPGNGWTLACLGALAPLDGDLKGLAAEISLCADFIKRVPGLVPLYVTPRERVFWASLLTALRHGVGEDILEAALSAALR